MVRAMTDEEARHALIAENLPRADMHPIEEAEGFQALIDRHRESADCSAHLPGLSPQCRREGPIGSIRDPQAHGPVIRRWPIESKP